MKGDDSKVYRGASVGDISGEWWVDCSARAGALSGCS